MTNITSYTEDRYKRMVQFLTDYIYTVEVYENKVLSTYHGPGCMAVTGYASEDYAADPELWYRMVHPDDREMVTAQASRALSGEDVPPVEHRIIHRDGSVRWVRNTIVLSRDTHGYLHFYDGLIRNITEQRHAQELAELKQKQLIQADKMVSLGTLVSGLAHEINNPNNYILLNIGFLRKAWKDIKPILEAYYLNYGDYVIGGLPYSQSYLKILQSLEGISHGAERIGRLIGSLSDFARQDDGGMVDQLDIRKVVEPALLILNNIIKKATNAFEVTYEPRIPKIRANPQQIEQVLINLINNACQSLTGKDQKITVAFSPHNRGTALSIRVTDQGKGVEPDDMPHVFEPFFTTRRESGGSGLGLYIAYNIVRQHGGDMQLTSRPGGGTTVEVILPAAAEGRKRK